MEIVVNLTTTLSLPYPNLLNVIKAFIIFLIFYIFAAIFIAVLKIIFHSWKAKKKKDRVFWCCFIVCISYNTVVAKMSIKSWKIYKGDRGIRSRIKLQFEIIFFIFYISFIRSNKQTENETVEANDRQMQLPREKIYIILINFQSGGVWLRLPSGYLRQLFHYTNCTQSLLVGFPMAWQRHYQKLLLVYFVGSNSLYYQSITHTICISFHQISL